jgi:hypothetical protein
MSEDLKKNAEQGDIEAMFEYGLALKDWDEQIRWIRAAAEKGHVKAMRWCSGHSRDFRDNMAWRCRVTEAVHAGPTDFDRFARAYAKWEHWYHVDFDPHTEDDLRTFHERVEKFLRERCSMSYSQLKTAIAPEHIEEGGYKLMPRRGIRRGMFDQVAQVFLAALSDCNQDGLDVFQLLQSIRNRSFLSEVFSTDDITWVRLADALVERWVNT